MNSEKISISHLLSIVKYFWFKNYFINYKISFLTIPFFLIAFITSLSSDFFDVFYGNKDLVFHENILVIIQQNNGNQCEHH